MGASVCDVFYPVYRRGDVLFSETVLARDEAKRVGTQIRDRADAIQAKFIDDLSECQGITNCQQVPDGKSVIRVTPTIIIDFPRMTFTVDNFDVEARVAVTVCVAQKQSKIWSRFNLLNSEAQQITSEQFEIFFSKVACVADRLATHVKDKYEVILQDHKPGMKLRHDYLMEIKSANADDQAVEDVYDRQFSGAFPKKVPESMLAKVETAMRLIDPQLSKLNLETREDKSSVQQFVGYEFFREIGIKDEHIHPDPLHLVCQVEVRDDGAKFVGVGYENNGEKYPPTKSLAHIGSSAICSEAGDWF